MIALAEDSATPGGVSGFPLARTGGKNNHPNPNQANGRENKQHPNTTRHDDNNDCYTTKEEKSLQKPQRNPPPDGHVVESFGVARLAMYEPDARRSQTASDLRVSSGDDIEHRPQNALVCRNGATTLLG